MARSVDLGYDVLDLTCIIQKSNNVGMSKLILDLQDPSHVPRMMRRFIFGQDSLMYPGGQSGSLPFYSTKQRFALAIISFGDGMTSSTIQITSAYDTIANQGRKPTISLVKAAASTSSEAVL